MIAVLVTFFNVGLPALLLYVAARNSLSIWISPLSLIALQLVVGTSIKGTLMLVQADFATRLDFGYEPALLLEAYLYLGMFVALLVAGYLVNGARLDRGASYAAVADTELPALTLRRLLMICVVVSVIVLALLAAQKDGVGSLLSLFQPDTLRGLQQYRVNAIQGIDNFGTTYSATAIFLNVNTLLFIVLLVQKHWRAPHLTHAPLPGIVRIGLVVTPALMILEAVVTGSRNQIAAYLLLYLAIVFGGPRRLSAKEMARLLGIVLVALALVSFMTNYRYGIDGLGFAGLAERLYLSVLQPVFYSEYFLSITKLTVIMSEVSGDALLWGQSLVSWTWGLIPRPLWPDKPGLSLGLHVRSVIYGLSGGRGGIPPTFPGELYINFAWAGLVLAPVYGYLLRAFEVACFRPRNVHRYRTHWFYFILLIPIAYNMVQNALGAVVVVGIAQCFIVGAVVWFVNRGARPGRRPRRRRRVPARGPAAVRPG